MRKTLALLLALVVASLALKPAAASWEALYALTPYLATGRTVNEYVISPDGRYVAYLADQTTQGRFELYTVRVTDATTGTRVSTTPVANGAIFNFAFTSDSSRVVYTGDILVDGETRLFSAPVDGSTPQVVLNGAMDAGTDVTQFAVLGTSVFFRANPNTTTNHIYRVPADGSSGRLRLTPNFDTDEEAYNFALSPDGTRIVYRANLQDWTKIELYSMRLDGSDNQRLTIGASAGGNVLSFQIAPDSRTVVFAGDLLIDEDIDLFSRPIDGSGIFTVLEYDNTQNQPKDILSYKITPDSSAVVFRLQYATNHQLLQGTAIDEDTRVFLHPLFENDVALGGDFTFSHDSRYVYFRMNPLDTTTMQLYRRQVDGQGQMDLINDPLPAGSDVLNFKVIPGSHDVVYMADGESDELFQLYRWQAHGGAVWKQTDATGGEDVYTYELNQAGDWMFIRADLDVDDDIALYALDMRAVKHHPYQVSLATPSGRDVTSFELDSSDNVVIRLGADSRYTLYWRNHYDTINIPLVVR